AIKIGGNYPEGSYRVFFDENGAILNVEQKTGSDKKDAEEGFVEGYIQEGYFYFRKKRDDHRHHAIDALAVALTNSRIFNSIAKSSTIEDFDPYGIFVKAMKDKIKRIMAEELDADKIRKEAREIVEKLAISYDSMKKVVASSKKKLYRNGKSLKNKEGKILYAKGHTARAPLHEESLYGAVTFDDGSMRYVIRRPVSYFSSRKHVEEIVDTSIRLIFLRMLDSGKSFKEIAEKGIFLPNRNGENVPVKNIRTYVEGNDLPKIRTSDISGLFIKTGGNYRIGIYGESNPQKGSKRSFITRSYFEAARLMNRHEPLFPQIHNGKSLLFSLTQDEMVILFDQHEDEIQWDEPVSLFNRLFKVVKFDQNGNIILVRHNLANVKVDKGMPVSDLNRSQGEVRRANFNTIKGIKVIVNECGEIERC
ncbi:MAG: hypothetical protein HUU43_17385, partial [Ignavibacteriaceae bacterium]|nr:hypothetical protein [Ignavibacteriaceae bacterium]